MFALSELEGERERGEHQDSASVRVGVTLEGERERGGHQDSASVRVGAGRRT